MTDLSVVIPVYNEEQCVVELYSRLKSTVVELVSSYELILVDDGSVDGSWTLIEDIAKNDPNIKAIKFSRNFGHHVAISAGLDQAEGDWVVLMDADLQDAPEDVARLYSAAVNGSADIVVAKRKMRKHGKVKQFLSGMFYAFLSRVSDIQFDPEVGVFRIMSKRVVAEICRLRESSRFFPGISQWVGFVNESIDVQHQARFAGETKYPLTRQIALAANATLSFTDKPLKIAIYIGLLFSLLGLVHGLSIVIRAMLGQIIVLGYASLMSAMLAIGGVTICTIGITGLYVGRIFKEVKNRPLYVVEEMLEGGKSAPQNERRNNERTILQT